MITCSKCGKPFEDGEATYSLANSIYNADLNVDEIDPSETSICVLCNCCVDQVLALVWPTPVEDGGSND